MTTWHLLTGCVLLTLQFSLGKQTMLTSNYDYYGYKKNEVQLNSNTLPFFASVNNSLIRLVNAYLQHQRHLCDSFTDTSVWCISRLKGIHILKLKTLRLYSASAQMGKMLR